MPSDRAIGRFSALGVFWITVVYVVTGVVWLLLGGDSVRRDPFGPVDPYLAILEFLIVLAAPLMVVMMAAVHICAPPGTKTCSLAALGFMILLAGVTCSIHFVQLTAVRQFEPGTMAALAPIISLPWQWPSVVFALDLLAWDVFFGLSMLFGALVFQGSGRAKAVRRAMLLSGGLCVAGSLGPATGDLRFQYMAIIGYAGVFPVVCWLLARLFARADPFVETARPGIDAH